VWGWTRARTQRLEVVVCESLASLLALSSHHADPGHGHSAAVVRTMVTHPKLAAAALCSLERRQLAQRVGKGLWTLTNSGRAEALKQQPTQLGTHEQLAD
jgi:hypothetical protein